MDGTPDHRAETCVELVLKALVATGGDHAIIRSGQVPLMTRDGHRYRISDSRVPKTAVEQIARCLLPESERRSLDEIGETRYQLPHRQGSSDDFIVDVIESGADLCVDIEHYRMSSSDEIPAEFFQSPRGR